MPVENKTMNESAESVLEGHPDKLCDLIADAVLDEYLRHDPDARVACEVIAAKQLVLVAGEISSSHCADIESIVRTTMADVGYIEPEAGISADLCQVEISVSGQSPFLRRLVPPNCELSASDQAVAVGFAIANDCGLIPRSSYLAKQIGIAIARTRREEAGRELRPDGKTLVSLGERRAGGDYIVISAQHAPSADPTEVQSLLRSVVLATVSPFLCDVPKVVVNPPTGVFHFGGPAADTGLTGRKLVADTYGPGVPCGGGALSGKDPSKIDRCATYAARWVAKSLVAAGLTKQVLVSLTYVIGEQRPVSVNVTALDKETDTGDFLSSLVCERVDLRPAAIIERLCLRQPIYLEATRKGHFGVDDSLPWEVASPDLF